MTSAGARRPHQEYGDLADLALNSDAGVRGRGCGLSADARDHTGYQFRPYVYRDPARFGATRFEPQKAAPSPEPNATVKSEC